MHHVHATHSNDWFLVHFLTLMGLNCEQNIALLLRGNVQATVESRPHSQQRISHLWYCI